LHLQKTGLQSTGTVRENRIKKDDKIVIGKKASRGTYAIKHDKNSGINYISIMNSKQVSVASSAAGVTLMLSSKRYFLEAQSKVDISFPKAMHVYNKYMKDKYINTCRCARYAL